MSKAPRRSDGADPAASVRARLAAGRTMAALKEAKDLAKRQPGAAAEALLAEAYRARVLDLAGQGLHDEARAVLRVAAERFPDAAATWERAATLSARAAGDLDDLLRAYRDAPDGAARAAVAAELESALRDLAPVARSSVLPADDPLRLAAERLRAAFEAAAEGALDEATRATLAATTVPAPLTAWGHFVRALDAFHRHADAEVEAALQAIPDASGVAAGKRLLQSLLRVEPPEPLSPAARRVLVGTTDGAFAAHQGLATLRRAGGGAEDSGPTRDLSARRDAAQVVLTELVRRQPRDAARFVWLLRRDSAPIGAPEGQHDGRPDGRQGGSQGVPRGGPHGGLLDELDDGLGHALFGTDWLRQTADLDAEDDPVLGLTTWLTWLMPHGRGDALRPLTDLELAELLAHLLPIARDAVAQVEKQLGVEVDRSLGDPAQLERTLEPWAGEQVAPEVDYALTCATVLAEALRRLRRRSGLAPHLADHRQLAEHAARLDPHPDRFALLESALGDDELDVRGLVLAAWAEQVRDDVEPWLRAIDVAQRAQRADQAAAALRQAQACAPHAARVLAAELRARWAQVREHVRAGDVSVAALAAADLAAEPCARDLAAQAALAAARHAFGALDREGLEGLVGDPLRTAAALEVVRLDLLGESIEVEEAQASDLRPRERLRRGAFLARLGEFAPMALQLAAVADVRLARGDLPADQEDRLALCGLGASMQDWELVEAASGLGLAVDGPDLARFVYFRAVALLHLEEDVDVGQDLLAAARTLAARAGDDETRRNAEALRRPLDDDFDDELAAAVLADERAFEKGARAVVADHKRPLTARERARKRRGDGAPPTEPPQEKGV